MGNYNFHPWVGSKYNTEGFNGKKVLVLGESHYCRNELSEGGRCFPSCRVENMKDDCYSQTEDVIEGFVYCYSGERYQQTFLCFERAVLGKELTQIEREDFWDRIVFYNYIQFSQSGPRKTLQANDWALSEMAFHELLEEFMPDYIIVWGARLYNLLPDFNGKHSVLSISETDKTDIWTYKINDKDIPAIKVSHPSSPVGKEWSRWHKYYAKFLDLNK